MPTDEVKVEESTVEEEVKVEVVPEETKVEEEVKVEETETEEETEIKEEVESDKDDLDLIDELLNESIEEKPTEPTFFPDKKENEDGNFIDEELLNDLDAGFEELEGELTEAKEVISERDKALEESKNTASAYSEALDKLGEHPILGPLNEKLLKGEEVNIPEYLQKSLQEDIDALPNMDEAIHENSGIENSELTLQQKLEQQAKHRY